MHTRGLRVLEGTTAWGIATRTSNMDMVTTEMNSERTTIAVKSVKTESYQCRRVFSITNSKYPTFFLYLGFIVLQFFL